MLDWVDGWFVVELFVCDCGLVYGDGLFEILVVCVGMLCFLECYLVCLEEGCWCLVIFFDVVVLCQELLVFCVVLGDGVVKLIVICGEGLCGYVLFVEVLLW